MTLGSCRKVNTKYDNDNVDDNDNNNDTNDKCVGFLVGKHSVKGMGRMVPCEETYKVEPSPHDKQAVTIPCGKLKDISRRDRVDQAVGPAFKLNYNEYIVYNVNQIKMRYILRIKFVFS